MLEITPKFGRCRNCMIGDITIFQLKNMDGMKVNFCKECWVKIFQLLKNLAEQ